MGEGILYFALNRSLGKVASANMSILIVASFEDKFDCLSPNMYMASFFFLFFKVTLHLHLSPFPLASRFIGPIAVFIHS